jgi:hypothetical protein
MTERAFARRRSALRAFGVHQDQEMAALRFRDVQPFGESGVAKRSKSWPVSPCIWGDLGDESSTV